MEMHRQGDLLFVRQEALPTDVPLEPRSSRVILEGETTGHAHRLQSDTPSTILETPDGQLWLDITQTTQVMHEEHAPVTLTPGPWLVIRQREYAPEAPRTVRD